MWTFTFLIGLAIGLSVNDEGKRKAWEWIKSRRGGGE